VFSAVDMAGLAPGDALAAHLSGVVDWPHKLVRDEASGALRLYDLLADPGETRDRAKERPDLAASLAEQLDAWGADAVRRALQRSVGPLSPEDEAVLQGLGYMGR
jgi:hypothetical protein